MKSKKTKETKTNNKRIVSGLFLIAMSMSLQSCSHKPAPLEEEGDPPMTTMEMRAPEEDTSEKWKIDVTPASAIVALKPVKLTIKATNQTPNANQAAPAVTPKSAPAHVLIVCKDGSAFQNLKPTSAAQDTFTTDVTFPHPGQYMVCLQFVTAPHKNHTVLAPLQVGKDTTGIAKLKPDADTTKTAGAYEFSLSSYPVKAGAIAMPTFRITEDKRPVSNIEAIDPAQPNDAGYAVLISDDVQNFVQTVPVSVASASQLFQTPIMFHTNVKKPGNYKMWTQFKINGKITTVDFSFKVDPSAK